MTDPASFDASMGALNAPRLRIEDPADVAIRPVRASDGARLAEIYNHYITKTAITFDTEPVTREQRTDWISHYAETGRHRLLVAEYDGLVLGYTASSRFHPRAAYDTTVETTIVCAPEAVGVGLGHRLYTALFNSLRDEDVHLAVALVTLPNDGSCRIHEQFGYTRRMVLDEVGRKFDRWWSVAWYARPFP